MTSGRIYVDDGSKGINLPPEQQRWTGTHFSDAEPARTSVVPCCAEGACCCSPIVPIFCTCPHSQSTNGTAA